MVGHLVNHSADVYIYDAACIAIMLYPVTAFIILKINVGTRGKLPQGGIACRRTFSLQE
jgi:hypothetical protein